MFVERIQRPEIYFDSSYWRSNCLAEMVDMCQTILPQRKIAGSLLLKRYRHSHETGRDRTSRTRSLMHRLHRILSLRVGGHTRQTMNFSWSLTA